MTWVEIFGDVTSVVFGDVTSMAKTDFFGDVTANPLKQHRQKTRDHQVSEKKKYVTFMQKNL